MANDTQLASIKRNLGYMIENLIEDMAKFRERFEKDPANALSWSVSTFAGAAKLEVLQTILRQIEGAEAQGMDEATILERAKAFATEKALDEARHVASSTSPTSNLIDNYKRSAWAETVSGFNCLFK